MIRNKINDKRYIGQSCNVYKVWKKDKFKCSNTKLEADIQQYGIENFDFSILETIPCETDTRGIREVKYKHVFIWKLKGFSLYNAEANNPNFKQTSDFKNFTYFLTKNLLSGGHTIEECAEEIGIPVETYLEIMRTYSHRTICKHMYLITKNNEKKVEELAEDYKQSIKKVKKWISQGEQLVVAEQKKKEKENEIQKTLIKKKEPCSYVVKDGFKTIEEALCFLKTHNFNIDCFILISVEDEIYAVSMETLKYQLLITKEDCYVRDSGVGSLIPFTNVDWDNVYKFPSPRISSLWDDTYKRELESIYCVKTEYIGTLYRGTYLEYNSITLIACMLNNTIK